MDISTLLFYLLASLSVVSAAAVVLSANPIYSALYLALTMVSLGFMFFGLDAYFIGGVQLIVYAGAVIILFTMVVMLFDLKKESDAFASGMLKGMVKIVSSGLFLGFLIFGITRSTDMLLTSPLYSAADPRVATAKDLAIMLFTKYLFAFEVLGLLLLLVAVGAVAVSRVKGGTHDPT